MIPNFINTNRIKTIVNTKGKAIKFSNGTMICIGKKSFTNVQITNLWGNVYTSGDDSMVLDDFPESFIEEPIVTISASPIEGCTRKFLDYD